jgi:hypothetical protein
MIGLTASFLRIVAHIAAKAIMWTMSVKTMAKVSLIGALAVAAARPGVRHSIWSSIAILKADPMT